MFGWSTKSQIGSPIPIKLGIWSENPDMWDSLDPYLLLVPQMETLVSVSWCEGSLDEFLLAQKWSISWSVGLIITYQPYESHYLAVELFLNIYVDDLVY